MKDKFTKYLAQPTPFHEMRLNIVKAEGIYLFDENGKKYTDLFSGIAVNVLGHRHPEIIKAIKKQTKKYLHLNVYGEYQQSETILLAEKLASLLPENLQQSFFVNSGSEAIEGAIKLSRLYTGRTKVISFKGSYHGSTLSAINLLGNERFKQPFRPLMPHFSAHEYNSLKSVDFIDENTACVILELIQTASGMVEANDEFLVKIREKCNQTGALLIFDEIQTSVGRLGNMFGFEKFKCIPDILCLAKSLGGGLPIGVFISSSKIMNSLNNGHPLLGHATTFGGHPLSCATALATLEVLVKSTLLQEVDEKNNLVKNTLIHPKIKGIKGSGLLLAVELENSKITKKFLKHVLNHGIVTNSFLFNDCAFAVIPPIIITKKQLYDTCLSIINILKEI